MRRTLRAYIKQYLNRYKGGLALVAGLMIFHIFVLYICGIPALRISDILRDWNLYFLCWPLYFAGYGTGIACGQ